MNQRELLFQFEEKYPFLYGIQVNGVPVYAALRDGVAKYLMGGGDMQNSSLVEEKGRIYPRRIIDSFWKLRRFSKAKTLVFTSSMFRRDKGRNLAAEYLLEKYSDAVIFEWPSRVEAYDSAYFADEKKNRYCPLDYYVLLNKIYLKTHRGEYSALSNTCSERIDKFFHVSKKTCTNGEQKAVEYLRRELPNSYASTLLGQRLFKQLFRLYHRVEYAIDFWGSARENITPVLPNHPKSVELQHGIITSIHPGYIYPNFIKERNYSFFGRRILVYGEKTKDLLIDKSIFQKDQIEVIGNPRLKMYEKAYGVQNEDRKLILFTSQPYEQDGTGSEFYSNAISYLKEIDWLIKRDSRWSGYQLGVKLHPRENNGIESVYKNALPDVQVFDNASELYQLLMESVVQITVSSTSLYEAAIFNTPTICIRYIHDNLTAIFGFEPWVADTPKEVLSLLNDLDSNKGKEYLQYLKDMTKNYM